MIPSVSCYVLTSELWAHVPNYWTYNAMLCLKIHCYTFVCNKLRFHCSSYIWWAGRFVLTPIHIEIDIINIIFSLKLSLMTSVWENGNNGDKHDFMNRNYDYMMMTCSHLSHKTIIKLILVKYGWTLCPPRSGYLWRMQCGLLPHQRLSFVV